MSEAAPEKSPPARKRFLDPDVTADGAPRAKAPFRGLETLWVNTGTLCNIECAHCYIESSPTNDRLIYITAAALAPFLDEAEAMGAAEIGFTGGEPFMNPDMTAMAGDALSRGLRVLILTNAMRPMMRPNVRQALVRLRARYGARLSMRVSIDHYAAPVHDAERGAGGFEATMAGLAWLAEGGFRLSVAGRMRWDEDEDAVRAGFARLFARRGAPLDAANPQDLVLFPEMDEAAPVPEISEGCWGVLGKRPDDVMCATSRMVIHRKGAPAPSVAACTLIPYDPRFEIGASLAEAARPVALNHPHCARFCVLGGASCSG